MSNISEFEKTWGKFITKLRGSLMEQTKNQPLSYSAASITLSDVAMAWSLSYDECGRWLLEYADHNPEKGTMVTQILTNDMKFTEIPAKKDFPEIAKIAVPAVGAVLGFGISHLLHASIFVQAVSAVVPAALIYPATKAVGESVNKSNQDTALNEYIAQLDKYKRSVLSVISD